MRPAKRWIMFGVRDFLASVLVASSNGQNRYRRPSRGIYCYRKATKTVRSCRVLCRSSREKVAGYHAGLCFPPADPSAFSLPSPPREDAVGRNTYLGPTDLIDVRSKSACRCHRATTALERRANHSRGGSRNDRDMRYLRSGPRGVSAGRPARSDLLRLLRQHRNRDTAV